MPFDPDETVPPGGSGRVERAIGRLEGRVDGIERELSSTRKSMEAGFTSIKGDLQHIMAKDASQNGHVAELERQVAQQAGATGYKRWIIPVLLTAAGVGVGVAGLLIGLFS